MTECSRPCCVINNPSGLAKGKYQERPGYHPSAIVNREYESKLYDYYGRAKYWS